mmetsp:Transcript_59395/g.159041  ORF Transcript_59395/g.159041 Transcript_59395/m.159041 type:complete len:231 (+) Transcript_59395:1299-1991(+)
MPLHDAEGANVLVGPGVRTCAHDVILLVVLCHELQHGRPMLGLVARGAIGPAPVEVLVLVVRVRGLEARLDHRPAAAVLDVLAQVGGVRACQHAQGEERVGSVDVRVGAGQLRDRLLQDAGPDLVVLGEPREERQASLAHGDAVVHHHGHDLLLAIVVEVDGVLPVLCQDIWSDQLSHLVGELAEGREGAQQPAVAQAALLQVARVHALDHVDVRELISQALAAARTRPA